MVPRATLNTPIGHHPLFAAAPLATVCLMVCISPSLFAATTSSTTHDWRFSGGMSYHLGRADGEVAGIPVRGVARGLGGRVQVPKGSFLALGAGGASLTVDYPGLPNRQSLITASYGGVTGEARLRVGQGTTAAIGVLWGGGRIRHLHLYESLDDDTVRARYAHHGLLMLAPYLALEHLLTHTINLVVTVEQVFCTILGNQGYLQIPKVQLGLHFRR